VKIPPFVKIDDHLYINTCVVDCINLGLQILGGGYISKDIGILYRNQVIIDVFARRYIYFLLSPESEISKIILNLSLSLNKKFLRELFSTFYRTYIFTKNDC